MMAHIPITRTQVCLPPRLRHICWVTGAECRPEQARGFCDPGGQGHQDPAQSRRVGSATRAARATKTQLRAGAWGLRPGRPGPPKPSSPTLVWCVLYF